MPALPRLLGIVALALLPWREGASAAGDLTGVASVIDGDTVEIHGRRVRLHGIDAPESAQLCERPGGERWRCGQRAALALADHIGRVPITCRGRDTDRYDRVVAVCFKGSEDLNAWLVAQGWAMAYRRFSQDYVTMEDRARASRNGIWSGRFVMPWDWRAGKRLTGARPPDDRGQQRCDIKGNINARGERIYHVPGGRWYARTRIDRSKGERWFCSEKEAGDAGWRRSGQ